MGIDIYKRYFVFSREQMDKMKSINAKMSKKITFGTVIVNGSAKIYTDIVTNMDKCKYADSILVTEGDIRKIKYTNPST